MYAIIYKWQLPDEGSKEEEIMFGFFDKLFDLNHDGKMDATERALEFTFMEETIFKDENESEEDYEETELELAGIDPEELEYMDDDERREILEEAGLDPDEFDF